MPTRKKPLKPRATPIEPGKPAPAFDLQDQNGQHRRLADYAGRRLVVFFYPKDSTSGCTTEACGFQASLEDFESINAAVVGISILPPKSKAKFASANDLSFPLLADDRLGEDGKPDPEVARAFGVWKQKSMYGRTYMGIERTTFIIDADGMIAHRFDSVGVKDHAAEVLARLEQSAG